MRWRAAALAFVGAGAIGACADGTTAPALPGGSTSAAPPSGLVWEDCGEAECASLVVPLDHDDPALGTIDLHVARRSASLPAQRIGVLLVNPGGPGIGGAYLAKTAEDFFPDRLLERFDVIAWDPRGTGSSDGVDCVDDLDALFGIDPTPDDDSERTALLDAATTFRTGCEERSGRLLRHVGTADSARDMDAIRAALGEEQISFLGFSYGSELGATFATAFPDRVRAMALDGAIDPGASTEDVIAAQAVAFDAALAAFLADCSGRTSCPFHQGGDAERAYDDLMFRLDREPIEAVASPPGRPTVGHGVALTAVLQALYDPAYWPTLASALARADDGDGSALLDLYDAYLDRSRDGSWDDTMESFLAIDCIDAPGPRTAAAVDARAARVAAQAPRLGAYLATTYWCLGWPAADAPRAAVTAAGAGPILVVGTVGDTATPYALTRRLAESLEDGVLLTWEGARHGAYLASSCVQDAVDTYLLEGVVPSDGSTCPS